MSKKRKSNCAPSKNYNDHFYASSDDEFKRKDSVDDFFLVTLALTVLLLPAIMFRVLVGADSGWVILGFVGGFVFGFGLFNCVVGSVKQYLGRWVSFVSFLVGGLMMLISWLLCK